MRVLVYAFTLLMSSALIFLVQPLFAKLLLPGLGGASSVWTTCMLFFQAMLLGGYAYAHLLTRSFPTLPPARRAKTQVRIHMSMLLLGLLFLPFSRFSPPFDASSFPLTWLLIVLMASVGLPFFILSASAPLLQVWFSKNESEGSKDPYFLYAASNLGSMIALVGYPFVLEPLLGGETQSYIWAVLYVVLLCFIFASSRFITQDLDKPSPMMVSIKGIRKAKWILYAFIPSSLMLGLTQHLTTDIASIPLLWMGPLALYLLTFILAFSGFQTKRFEDGLPQALRILVPLWVALPFALTFLSFPILVKIAIHASAFFSCAWFFHSLLAIDRPSTDDLTLYFFLVSLGGVLGGVFNTIVSPLIFSRSVEYFFIAILSIAFVPQPPRNDANPELLPVFYAAISMIYLWSMGFFSIRISLFFLIAIVVALSVAMVVRYRPKAANLALSLGLLFGLHVQYRTPGLIVAERSFFGAYKIFDRVNGKFPYRSFSHGTTSHGKQALLPELKNIPLSYHHSSGPAGQVFTRFFHKKTLVVGLGAGAMAAYAGENDSMRFYEIDPLVASLAKEYFGFLDGCLGRCEVLIGDGRKLLEKEEDGAFDIIMLDAYNSDSVPTHLLSIEAFELYVTKLSGEGVLLFNASNRYIDIEKVIGAAAKALGLVARTRVHFPTKKLKAQKVQATLYVVVARKEEHLRLIARDKRWRPTKVLDALWTDDYASVFRALK